MLKKAARGRSRLLHLLQDAAGLQRDCIRQRADRGSCASDPVGFVLRQRDGAGALCVASRPASPTDQVSTRAKQKSGVTRACRGSGADQTCRSAPARVPAHMLGRAGACYQYTNRPAFTLELDDGRRAGAQRMFRPACLLGAGHARKSKCPAEVSRSWSRGNAIAGLLSRAHLDRLLAGL